MTTFRKMLWLMLVVLAYGTAARAQSPAAPPPAATAAKPAPLIPLTVQVVISKFQGDKKIASLPFALAVNANETGTKAELNTGVQILIPMVTIDGKTTGPVYKDVGTTIRCSATAIDGGRFKLELAVEDASVYPDAKLPVDGVRGPWLQAFRSSQTLLLKDGQTTQYTTATDKVTGEVTKVEVTLTVVK